MISYVTGKQDVQEDKPMGYEPLKFIPQQTRAWRIQPMPEPIPAPDQPGPWATIAHKLWRVISVLASLAMVYLVWTIVAARLI